MQMHTGRTLAFLGDAVWSLKVREYFVDKGYEKGKDSFGVFVECNV